MTMPPAPSSSSPPPAAGPTPDSTGLAAARHSAVLIDLAPMAMIDIRGADAAAFLHGQLSSDVKGLTVGACQYTSYNSPKGRMLANFVLWRADAEAFVALLPADLAAAFARRLSMFVMRSKLALADVSAATARFGIGGPAAATVLNAAFGVVPDPFAVVAAGGVALLGLPGARYVVIAPGPTAADVAAKLGRLAPTGSFAVWQWLTIDAGVPVVTAATQDQFVAQMANWDVLGGVNFQKGCYPGQEIVARTRYLGRLKERTYAFHVDHEDVAPGARLYSTVFGDQPCGTVVNAAPAPEGGVDFLAVIQITAAQSRDVRLARPDGTRVLQRALPYAMPAATEPVKR